MGRHSSFTPEIAERICAVVEETGSIREAALQTGIARATISRWTDEHDDFKAAIARAKLDGYAERAERAVEDAKSAEDAALGRLAFDAERWFLSKIDPKRYGEKLDLTSDNKPLGEGMVDASTKIAALLEEARRKKMESEGGE